MEAAHNYRIKPALAGAHLSDAPCLAQQRAEIRAQPGISVPVRLRISLDPSATRPMTLGPSSAVQAWQVELARACPCSVDY